MRAPSLIVDEPKPVLPPQREAHALLDQTLESMIAELERDVERTLDVVNAVHRD